MDSTVLMPPDTMLLGRIASLREAVRGHRQRALEMWNACSPAEEQTQQRPTMGRFTELVAHE